MHWQQTEHCSIAVNGADNTVFLASNKTTHLKYLCPFMCMLHLAFYIAMRQLFPLGLPADGRRNMDILYLREGSPKDNSCVTAM